MFFSERFQSDLQLLRFFFFLALFFCFFVREGVMRAHLDAHGHINGRLVFTHIAFEWQARIGLFEKIPGRAGNATETALAVLFAVDGIRMPAGAFGRRIVTTSNRHIAVVEFIDHHPDARAGRVDAAILWTGMICGARDLACTAANSFIKINFDFLDDSLF